jgi:hypothetical protein
MKEQEMTKYKYDTFVSYRHREPTQGWVQKMLVPALEAENLTICIDYRDFQLGALLIPEMERAVKSSRYTLAILNPDYLESNFTELEQVMAQQLGLEQSQRRLITIMRESCTPPLNMRSRLWLDMTDDIDFSTSIRKLSQELRKPNLI